MVGSEPIWQRSRKMQRIAGVFFCSLLIVTGASASEDYVTRTALFQVTDNDSHAIPLNNNGATTHTFFAQGGQRFIISYNAECMAQGPIGSKFTISIIVDGERTRPDSGTAFCSPSAPDSQTSMAVERRVVAKVAFAGNHTVQVMGTGVGTTLWQVGDSILILGE